MNITAADTQAMTDARESAAAFGPEAPFSVYCQPPTGLCGPRYFVVSNLDPDFLMLACQSEIHARNMAHLMSKGWRAAMAFAFKRGTALLEGMR